MTTPRRFAVAFACLLLAAAAAPTQAPSPGEPGPATTRRSLADGLVRELVESQRLRPPRCESGLELGAGDGPLGLLVRLADGTFDLRALQRGFGDHGQAPTMPTTPVEPELAEAAAAAAEAPAAPAKIAVARLQLTLSAPQQVAGGEPRRELLVGTREAPALHRGQHVDRTTMAELLAAQFAATKDTPVGRQLLIAAAPDVDFLEVLTTAELAHAAGFTDVFFDGAAADVRKIAAASRQTILDLPKTLEWQAERSLHGVHPIHDGELLILVDGPARWGDIAPIYMLCARIGVWRISLVGQRGPLQRYKVPTNLPVDRG